MIGSRRFFIFICCLLMALLGTSCEKPYGEYDYRDIPSSIHISAKTEGNLHAHATVTFDATNPFPIICTGVFNEGMTGKEIFLENISSNGIDVAIKQKWKGFCSYKFNSIAVTCTDSAKHYHYDSKNAWPKEAYLRTTRGEFSQVVKYQDFLGSDLFVINDENGEKEFYNCLDSCENTTRYTIDQKLQHLNISCEAKKSSND
jgi:hypothetical protein